MLDEMNLKKSTKNHPFSKMTLAIVCPMANELDNARAFILAVLDKCRPFGFMRLHFFAIFDSVCTDGTYDLLLENQKSIPELTLVYAAENRSVVDAYVRGYQDALKSRSDWILEIDAGFSHQPDDIPQFFNTMVQGYDCVFGSRFCPGASYKETSFKRYLLSRGGTWVTNFLLGTRLDDMASGFELFSRRALSDILSRGISSRGPFFQTEIRTYAHDYKIVELPIHYASASHNMNLYVLKDAFINLWRLFRLRLKGQLFYTIDKNRYSIS